MPEIVLDAVLPSEVYVLMLRRRGGKLLLSVELTTGEFAVRTFSFSQDVEQYRESREDEVEKVSLEVLHRTITNIQEKGTNLVGFVLDDTEELYRL